MENLDLQEIRGQLDEIDTRLVELFEKRMELTEEVARLERERLYTTDSGKSRSWPQWQPWPTVNSTGRECMSSSHRL